MARQSELTDIIKVSVTTSGKISRTGGGRMANAVFSACLGDINKKIQRATKVLPNRAARRLANMDKQDQKSAISSLGAKCSGNLFRSINANQFQGGGGTAIFNVGTTSAKKGYIILIHGRGPVQAKKGKFLKFTPKCKGNPIFVRSVGGAAPRNYMQMAKGMFSGKISGVIKEEVDAILSE